MPPARDFFTVNNAGFFAARGFGEWHIMAFINRLAVDVFKIITPSAFGHV